MLVVKGFSVGWAAFARREMVGVGEYVTAGYMGTQVRISRKLHRQRRFVRARVLLSGVLLTTWMVAVVVCYRCNRKAEDKHETAEKKTQETP